MSYAALEYNSTANITDNKNSINLKSFADDLPIRVEAMNASREILTPELEAEISALYRQMQASRVRPVECSTMPEQENGPRMLTALLGVLFLSFTLGIGAWIIAHVIRFSVR